MVTIETGRGARLVWCGAYCLWATSSGNPLDAVPYEMPCDIDDCVFCAGCGRRLDLNGAACVIHGDRCWYDRCFLRTVAAIQFCALYRMKHGQMLSVTASAEWRRASALWLELPGADGLELYDRVMAELAE